MSSVEVIMVCLGGVKSWTFVYKHWLHWLLCSASAGKTCTLKKALLLPSPEEVSLTSY